MDRIRPHKVIGLYYDDEIREEEVKTMIKSFDVKKYRIGHNYVYLEFREKQYFNCWTDYRCEDQVLDKYIIVA